MIFSTNYAATRPDPTDLDLRDEIAIAIMECDTMTLEMHAADHAHDGLNYTAMSALIQLLSIPTQY